MDRQETTAAPLRQVRFEWVEDLAKPDRPGRDASLATTMTGLPLGDPLYPASAA